MQIRDAQDGDRSGIRSVITAAFVDEPVVADLSEALSRRPDPGAALVAVEQQEAGPDVVGVTQLSTSWVDAARALVPVLVLSPLAVRPDRQRRGVGRALVQAAIERAEQLGSPLLFLEGDPAYYGRLGWQRASESGFTAPSVRIPDAAFQVVVLPAFEQWMVGAVVYNDTFWSHDCVGLRSSA